MKTYLNGIQHLGLPTRDLDATVKFYGDLGFDVAYDTVLGVQKVAFLKLHNLVIETYEESSTAMANGAIDHVALDVSDIEAVYAIAQERGYQILEDGIQFLPFWAKGVRFFTILGPNHEKIEFSQML